MTLTELAAFITSKLSDTDAASVTACKSYINRRYQMIWDSAIWTETLGVLSKTVTPASSFTDSTVVISATARNGGFETAGSGSTFANWTVVQAVGTITRETSSPLSGTASCKFSSGSSTGTYISQEVLVPGRTYTVTFDGKTASGSARLAVLNSSGTLYANSSTFSTLNVSRSATFVATDTILRLALYEPFGGTLGDAYIDSVTLTSTLLTSEDNWITLSGVPNLTFFHSTAQPITAIDFPVAVRFTTTGQDDGVEIPGNDWVTFFQLDPNQWNNISGRTATPTNFVNLPKDANGNARVKPVPAPLQAGTLFVLGKLKWVELASGDTPCLRGIDNALLAYAEGDMLERARQYSKAQSKYAEASAQVQIMKDIEKGQQQSVSTIMPLGDSYYSPVCPQ